jgi:uncharacterized protein
MDIQHIDNGIKGEFYIEQNDARVAEMAYVWEHGEINIVHTEVNPALKGHGIGNQLVAHAIEWARKHNVKIFPTCPFVQTVMRNTPAYHDVLSARYVL